MKNVIEQIIRNLHSYSVFVIIGIIIYLFYEFFIATKIKSWKENKKLLILILLSILLPFCNCIAITFMLYDIMEMRKIQLYLIATFVKVPALILIFSYFGKSLGIDYLFLVILIIGIYLSACHFFNTFSQGKNNKFEETADIVFEDKKISVHSQTLRILSIITRFSFIYFLSTVIMSFLEFITPKAFIVNVIANAEHLNVIEFLLISLTRYICIPNDITLFASMVAGGMNIKYFFTPIVIGTLFNISECITIFTFLKKKFLFFAMVAASTIATCLNTMIVSLLFNNSFSFNYDLSKVNNYIKIVNILNLNPNSFLRYVSTIMIIILAVCYMLLPFYNKGNQ